MKQLLLILSLLLTCATTQAQRYRLVADSTFTYKNIDKQNITVFKVMHYGYKKDNNHKRTYDNPRQDCDTFAMYLNEHPSGLELLIKDVRSRNNNGLVDTESRYMSKKGKEVLASKVVYKYSNDTAIVATYYYKPANKDDKEDNGTLTLFSKDTLEYDEAGLLVKRTRYSLRSNIATANNRYKTMQKGEGLLKMEVTSFVDGNPAVTEYYFSENCPELEGNQQGVLKRKRYVYDDDNQLSFNSYAVASDDTEQLWDSTSNVYNIAGNLVEVYYTTHYRNCATSVWVNKYTYNKNGKLQREEKIEEFTQNSKHKYIDVYEYTYDDDGRVETKTLTSPNEAGFDDEPSKDIIKVFYTAFGEKKEVLKYSARTENGAIKKTLNAKTAYTYEQY